MSVLKNITGEHYGRLIAQKFVGRSAGAHPHSLWKCLCSCENSPIIRLGNLQQGLTTSCGCGNREAAAKRFSVLNRTHGHALHHGKGCGTRTYKSWGSAKRRAHNHDGYHPSYKCVGMCKRWAGPHGFIAFLKDMGPRPPHTTLGRLQDTGDYKPSNCKWMTHAEQKSEKRKKFVNA